MAKTPPEITTEMMDVDAVIAEEFLKANQEPEEGVEGTNRRLSWMKVEEYRDAMLAGEWMENHQGIAFDWNGHLGDGQKRLKAIIEANKVKPGIKIRMMVSWNVDPKSIANTVDLMARRTPADFLAMAGEVNVTQLSSTLKQLYCYHYVAYKGETSWRKVPSFTPTVMKHTLAEFPKSRDAVRLAGTNQLKGVINSTAASTLMVLSWQYRPEIDVHNFIVHFKTGANMFPGNPILTMRNFLQDAVRRKRPVTAAETLAMGIKVLLKWHNQEALHKMQWRQDEPMPDIRRK